MKEYSRVRVVMVQSLAKLSLPLEILNFHFLKLFQLQIAVCIYVIFCNGPKQNSAFRVHGKLKDT